MSKTGSKIEQLFTRPSWWPAHLHLPYLPALGWALKYKKEDVLADLIAGLTVGVVLVPQGMAYALLARLPPVYGLYAAIMPPILYALFGTSGQLMVGPVALVSLFVPKMFLALHIHEKDVHGKVSAAAKGSLLVGMLLVFASVLKLGRLLKFCSHSVMAAFTTAAGIFIGLTQLKHLFGLKVPEDMLNYQQILYVFQHAKKSNKYSLMFGFGGIAFLLFFKYAPQLLLWKFPQIKRTRGWKLTKSMLPFAPVLLVVGSTLIAIHMHYDEHVPLYDKKKHPFGLKIVGHISKGLSAAFHVPSLSVDEFKVLVPTCAIVAVLAYLESYSVAYKFAAQLGYAIDASQELFALGAANIVSSFASGYPTTGSFSRTAIAADAGSRTPFAGLVVSAVIMLTLTCLSVQLKFIPMATLAAIIEVAVLKLFDWPEFMHAFRVDRAEFAVMCITAVVTVIFSIDDGLFCGVGASLLLLLYRVSEGVALGPKNEETPCSNMVMVMGKLPKDYQWVCIKNYLDAEQLAGVQVLRVCIGPLLFTNCKDFKDHVLVVTEKNHHKGEFIILDCSGMTDIDMAGLSTIFSLAKELRTSPVNAHLVLANTHERVIARLRKEVEQRSGHDAAEDLSLGLETAALSVEDVYEKQVVTALYKNKATRDLPAVTKSRSINEVTILATLQKDDDVEAGNGRQ